MIYSNRTSHSAEKFISSSLSASSHPPPPLYLLDVMSAEFAPSLNISQNKWTLEEGNGGSGGIRAVPSPAQGEAPLGKDSSSFPAEPELQSQLGDGSPRDT